MVSSAISSVFKSNPYIAKATNTTKSPTLTTKAQSNTQSVVSKMTPYKAVDSFFGGYLPGGVSPTAVKTTKLNTKTAEKQALLSSTRNYKEIDLKFTDLNNEFKLREAQSNARAKSGIDLLDTTFLEKFGIGVSPQERVISQMITQDTFGKIVPNITDTALSNQGITNKEYIELFKEEKQPSFTESIGKSISYTIPLLALGFIGLMAIKKK